MIKTAVIGGTNCIGENMELVSLYSDYDVLLVSYMSCTMLAECALGLNRHFSRAFLDNKPIYVLKSGLEYKKIKDTEAFKMYSGYRWKLQSFGVKFTDRIDKI